MRMIIAMVLAAATGFIVTINVLPVGEKSNATTTETCGTPYCNVG